MHGGQAQINGEPTLIIPPNIFWQTIFWLASSGKMQCDLFAWITLIVR